MGWVLVTVYTGPLGAALYILSCHHIINNNREEQGGGGLTMVINVTS